MQDFEEDVVSMQKEMSSLQRNVSSLCRMFDKDQRSYDRTCSLSLFANMHVEGGLRPKDVMNTHRVFITFCHKLYERIRASERMLALSLLGAMATDNTLRPVEIDEDVRRVLSHNPIPKFERFGYTMCKSRSTLKMRYLFSKCDSIYPDMSSTFDVDDIHIDLFNHLYLYYVHLPKMKASMTKKRKRDVIDCVFPDE